MLTWILLTLCACALLQGASSNPQLDVEIQQIWGGLRLKAGTTQSINCTVSNPGEEDMISWFLDDRPLVNKNKVVYDVAGRTMDQTYTLTADISMDETTFQCRCGPVSDSFRISVFDVDIPEKVILDKPLNVGDNVTLQVGVVLYPPPEEGDVYWEVLKPDRQVVTRLEPGQNDIYGIYTAAQVDVKGELKTNFLYRLLISYVDLEEAENKHYLHIHHQGSNHTVQFKLTVQETEHDRDTGLTASTELSSVTVKNETSVLGWGVWTVLIVLTLIIGLTVVYCFYRRKLQRERRKQENRAEYTEVKQKEQPV